MSDSPKSLTEAESVELWREGELLDAGYPPQLAATIASRNDVDLHRAVWLIRAVRASGGDAMLAAEILL